LDTVEILERSPSGTIEQRPVLTLSVADPRIEELEVRVYDEVIGRAGRSGYRTQLDGGSLGRRLGPAIDVLLPVANAASPDPRRVELELDMAAQGAVRPGLYPVEVVGLAGDDLSAPTTGFVSVLGADAAPIEMLILIDLAFAPSIAPDGTMELDTARRDHLLSWLDLLATQVVPGDVVLDVNPSALDALAQTSQGRSALERAGRGVEHTTIDRPWTRVDIGSHLSDGSPVAGRLLQQLFLEGRRTVRAQLRGVPDGGIDRVRSPEVPERLPWWADREALLVVDPDVVIRSEPGRDAPFTISLPASAGEQAANDERSSESAEGEVALDDGAEPLLGLEVEAELGTLIEERGSADARLRLMEELLVRHHVAPSRPRALALVLGRDIEPSVGADVIRQLSDEPLVRLVGPDDITIEPSGTARVPSRDAVPVVEAAEAIERLTGQLAAVASSSLEPGFAEPLSRATLGLASADPDERPDRITAIERLLDRERPDVVIRSGQQLRLTSRQATLPLQVTNQGERPTLVRIEINTTRLELLDVPEQGLEVELSPGSNTVDLDVRLRGSGGFTAEVLVTTADGSEMLDEGRLEIDSTVVSGVGWVISGVALLVLLAWWARDLKRSQRDERLIDREPPDRVPDTEH